jgi:hypothetical protein
MVDIFDFEDEDGWRNEFEQLPPVAMDLIKDQHVERLRPKYWLNAARNLKSSADVIFGKVGAHLLYGFAFENLLKGIIIAKYPAIGDPCKWGITEDEDKALVKLRGGDPKWATHDMRRLVELADISIRESDLRLLWMFEGLVTWSGRYPTALSAPRSVRIDEGGVPDFITYPDPNDREVVSMLFAQLEGELVKLIEGAEASRPEAG